MEQHHYPHTRPFLLMEGGPLYRIERRLGFIKKNAPLRVRRAIFAGLLTWVPLLVLSIFEGKAWGHTVPVPYLHDFSAYSRFLLAIPLLMTAELLLGPRIAEAAEHFVKARLVTVGDFAKFDAAIENGLRLRDSVSAEIVQLVMAYAVTISAFLKTAVHVETWYGGRMADGLHVTMAGWWLLVFCVPLFNFLLLRWIWRVFLWLQFLQRMSKLNLQLFPTHPDEAAGLGFTGEAQRFFGILLFAYSCGAAGVIANSVMYDHIPLKNYAVAIGIYAFLGLLLLTIPLAVFTPKLLALKRTGLHRYGALATTYTGSFQRKWIEGQNPEGEQLLGSGDIQSLADLGNSYGFIEKMNALPVNPRSLLHLLVAALLPMTPLLLTIMPLKDLLGLLMKVLV